MQLHQLRPKNKFKKIKRVGRGGKRGTYCGKGQKGQSARSGKDKQPIIRVLLKRYPKLRGFDNKPKQKKIVILNLKEIEKNFNSEEKITPETLIEKNLVKIIKGKIPKIKILGGEFKLSKKLEISNCLFSQKVKEIVEANGGTIEI